MERANSHSKFGFFILVLPIYRTFYLARLLQQLFRINGVRYCILKGSGLGTDRGAGSIDGLFESVEAGFRGKSGSKQNTNPAQLMLQENRQVTGRC